MKAVEQNRGATGFKAADGESLKDVGDGELNGGGVFQQAQVDGHGFAHDAAGVLDVFRLDGAHADELVELVESGRDELGWACVFVGEFTLLATVASVKVAEDILAQRRRFAADAGGHDVFADAEH